MDVLSGQAWVTLAVVAGGAGRDRRHRGLVELLDPHRAPDQPHGDGGRGYRFTNYWWAGLPLFLTYSTVAILMIGLLWL